MAPLGTVNVTPDDIAVDHMTSTVTFTCQSLAGANLNYTWLFNGFPIFPNISDNITVNNSELTVNSVNYLLGGTYTCIVSNMAGMGNDSSDLYGKL